MFFENLKAMRLGQVLVEAKFLTQQQRCQALQIQYQDPTQAFGAICIQKGWIQPSQLMRVIFKKQRLPKFQFIVSKRSRINLNTFTNWLLPQGISHRLIDSKQPMHQAVAHKAIVLLSSNPKAAKRYLKQARQHNPRCLLLWQLQAFEQLRYGKTRLFQQNIKQLTPAERQHVEVQFLYALLLIQIGKLSLAVNYLKNIIRQQTVHKLDILFCIAFCYCQLQQQQKAKLYFSAFLELTKNKKTHRLQQINYAEIQTLL